MNSMIIHSFFSDGLYEWAKLFLDSFKYLHGDTEYKIVFKTLGLTNDQVIGLYDRYFNLDVISKQYNWEQMSDDLNVSIGRLKVMKDEIEHGSDKVSDYYKWKILMSVEERYRKAIPEVIDLYKKHFSHVFHLDIDMYFVNRIDLIEKEIKKNDITLEVRTTGYKSKMDRARVAGGIMGFDMNAPSTRRLINSWCKFIDAISTRHKPRDYGQTSLFYAYKYMNGNTKWGRFKFGKEMSMFEDSKSIVWSGNRGNADEKLILFKKHFSNVTNGYDSSINDLNKKIEERRKRNGKLIYTEKYDTIVHSFLTDGMFDWGILFLKSLKKFNNERYPVILSTRDLEEYQIKELEDIYCNLIVLNEPLKMNKMCREIDVPKHKMLKWKKEIESGNTDTMNFKWKLYMSVMERYRRSLKEIITKFDCKTILHFDIDTCIRGKIDELESLVKQYDVSLRFRNQDQRVKGRICGNLIGITINDRSVEFLNRWIQRINNMGIRHMPKGYGQISLYETYKDMENDITWGHIDNHIGIDREFDKHSLIWEGNNSMDCKKNNKMERYIQEIL